MNLTELGAALGPFFDISGSPSHQQLRDAFARHGLGHLDPAPEGRTSNGSHLGKMTRLRGCPWPENLWRCVGPTGASTLTARVTPAVRE